MRITINFTSNESLNLTSAMLNCGADSKDVLDAANNQFVYKSKYCETFSGPNPDGGHVITLSIGDAVTCRLFSMFTPIVATVKSLYSMFSTTFENFRKDLEENPHFFINDIEQVRSKDGNWMNKPEKTIEKCERPECDKNSEDVN